MKNLLLFLPLVLVGCSGSNTELSASDNQKFKADLNKGVDMSKASPEQKAGFENFMKSRGGQTPAPSAPGGK